jgi:2-dehydropantoate 2-reductase
MRYVIYGAGAVGGAIGGRLFQHGHDTVLIARGDHLAAIRERGLTLESPAETVALPVPAVGHPSEIEFRDDDVVFLTMKAQDTEGALLDLRAAAGDSIPVFCAQNGVANERLALRRFGRVYGVVVMLPATHLEPGVVQANSSPTTGMLDVGCYPSGADELAARVAEDIKGSTFESRVYEHIMRWKYAKLLMNLGNALQAACGLGADTGDVMRRLRDEALACYRAAGIDCASAEEVRERRGDALRLAPTGDRRRMGGSSWQSLARGAGSIEVDFLNGEIALLGRLHGVPAPANSALQRVANRLVHEGKPPGTVDPEEMRREIALEESRAEPGDGR